MHVSLITFPANDLTATKHFFRELIGSDPYADYPQYVGYRDGAMEIGLVPKEHGPGALPFWTVSDIAATLKALEAAGGTVVREISDVGYGLLVAAIKDPNGSVVGLRQPPKG
ncbi:MAG: VOC family protein [Candidatus Eremiobacteraeota bacterium]|nr:VOC family protein [Candidatus Eremiobacteraeota bacterium]